MAMFKPMMTLLREKYQSLIVRIILYFVISAVAVALVLGWNFSSRIKPRFENEVLPNLSQYIQYLLNDMGTPPDLNKARALADRLPFDLRIEGEGIDWSSNQDLLSINHYRFKTAPRPYQAYKINSRSRDHLLLTERQDYRYLFTVDSSYHSGSRDRHGLLFILLGGILVTLYFGIRRLFKPLSDISKHLTAIGSGQLDDTLNIKGKGEIAQLAQGINQMAVEIKSMLDSKASLLLAISHELRSPITRMRINVELLDDDKTRETLREDLHEMEALVAGILESERLNTRHAVLNDTFFNLLDMIDDVIAQYFADSGIETDLVSSVVRMDEARIRFLLKNLIDNARRYSPESGEPVKVKLSNSKESLTLIVSDHGAGISAEDLPHITEPFYRTDNARSRQSGGYGLGLYLCKLIVEAHKGTLQVQSTLGIGTTISAIFPNSHQPDNFDA